MMIPTLCHESPALNFGRHFVSASGNTGDANDALVVNWIALENAFACSLDPPTQSLYQDAFLPVVPPPPALPPRGRFRTSLCNDPVSHVVLLRPVYHHSPAYGLDGARRLAVQVCSHAPLTIAPLCVC